MKKTDISRYAGGSSDNDYRNGFSINESGIDRKQTGKLIYKLIITLFMILAITGTITMISLIVFIFSLSKDSIDYDVRSANIQLTSFVYVNDENGNPQEFQRVYNVENRVHVDFDSIPDSMKNAMVAIEDKRFYRHHGVDWFRTASAVISLATGNNTYGGSTITQQLIKNLTEDNEVSITRKIREIFRALNFEKKYSKDEILEAYLNVVNFGSGCRGVQAAANLYFDKDIKDCSIAQCAAIAGITQNPAAYTPLVHPEKNKARRTVVINEMYNQKMITKEEYESALTESENMTFVGNKNSDSDDNSYQIPIRDWYTEALFNDVVEDLQSKLNIGKSAAEQMLYTQGLKIYSAMDKKAQGAIESVIADTSVMPKDTKLDLGYVMMDFDGRVLASMGCRAKKTGNLWYDKANKARRQPGSTIKPIAVYAPAIDLGMYNYSSIIPDQPLKVLSENGTHVDWPKNWYKGYKGNVTLQWALEKSANAPAAQVLNNLTTKKSYNFLTNKLGFKNLDIHDSTSLAALATGGTHVGVTVREMTAAFQIFGNGGIYNKPYMYFYVTDRNGKVILDNRQNVGSRAISSQTATIMNRLLHNVVVGPEGTGRGANIPGWNVALKTGTTNDDHDSWVIGLTPYAVAGIWTGYDTPRTIRQTSAAGKIWKASMIKFLEGKPVKDYNYDPSVVSAQYCKTTGCIANSGVCGATATGYYDKNHMPEVCNGSHNGTVEAFAQNTSSENPESSISENSTSDNSQVSSNIAA